MIATPPNALAKLARALLEDAIGNLRLRLSRSLLALIGISVGTAAVIAMLHIGHNARAEAMRQFEEIGADFVMINPPWSGSRPISQGDIADLMASNSGLSQAAPIIAGTGLIIEGRDRIGAMPIGTTGSLAPLLRITLAAGRFVSELDGRAPYAVIGADVARRIADTRHHPIHVGDTIRMDNHVLTVVGILAPQALNSMIGMDFNSIVIVTLDAMARYVRYPTIGTVVARLAASHSEAEMATATMAFFRTRIRGGEVRVQAATMLLDGIEKQVAIYGHLLLAIGIVSLAMGGIGIMNVMLMSVMERQEEIGLRAAIGAQPLAIMTMFLMESLLLALAGSASGIVLGVLAGWLFVRRSGWHFEVAPASLPLGFGMAIVVGLVFGLYPAWRAASLQPIEALRRG